VGYAARGDLAAAQQAGDLVQLGGYGP